MAFGALVLGAVVTTQGSGAVSLSNLGSSLKNKAVTFSLPAIEREEVAPRAIADLGRSAKQSGHSTSKYSSKHGNKSKRSASSDAWGIEATSSLGKKKSNTPRAVDFGDLEDDDANDLVFALERHEDGAVQERATSHKSSRSSKKHGSKKREGVEDDESDVDVDDVESASAEELSEMFEMSSGELVSDNDDPPPRSDDDEIDAAIASAVDEDFEQVINSAAADVTEERSIDDLFEPVGTEADDTYQFEAQVGGSTAGDVDESGEESDTPHQPHITPDMTYEEQQAEYARFAVEEAERNDLIAAQALEQQRIAAEQEEIQAAGAPELEDREDVEKIAYMEQRRAEFEREEAQRRAEFEAGLQGGAELGVFKAEAPEGAQEALGPSSSSSDDAEGPEASYDDSHLETHVAEAPEAGQESDWQESEPLMAESPSGGEDFSIDSSTDSASVPEPDDVDSPSMAPGDKHAILIAAEHTLEPVSDSTVGDDLAEYAKHLADSAVDVTLPGGENEVAEDIADTFMVRVDGGSEAQAPSGDEEIVGQWIQEPVDAEGGFETSVEHVYGNDAFAPAPSIGDDLFVEDDETDALAPAPDAFAFLTEEGTEEITVAEDIDANRTTEDDIDAVNERLVAALGAVVDERSAAGERLRSALGRTSKTAKVATFNLDDDAAFVATMGKGKDSSVSEKSGAHHESHHHHASHHGKDLETSTKHSSETKHASTKTSSHKEKHSDSLSKTQVARGWKPGDESVLTPSGIAKHAHAGDAHLSKEFLTELPTHVPDTDREFQKWETLSETDEVAAPSDVGVVGEAKKGDMAHAVHAHQGSKRGHRSGAQKSDAVEQEDATTAATDAVAAEAEAVAAADEEALRVDTTLDAVQQAIADTRRDDRPAATLMLAPLSVVGVAGVVVIAILLVRHRDPPRRGVDGDGESVSLLGDKRDDDDVELARDSPAEALTKTSNANLRALFGSVGEFGRKENFATPSETDAESASESVRSVRLTNKQGKQTSSRRVDVGRVPVGSGKPPVVPKPTTSTWTKAYEQVRSVAEAAERFADTRTRALRLSVQRTARMATAAEAAQSVEDEENARLAQSLAPPTKHPSQSAESSPRAPAASVMDVANEIESAKSVPETPPSTAPAPNETSAFSQSEMRRAKSRSPPSSFVDGADGAFGSGVSVANGSPQKGGTRFTNGDSASAVSVDARRRFREAANLSAHARAFAHPPPPHLTSSLSDPNAENRDALVMGAGRKVSAPLNENGAPKMVKSTTRFI